MTEAYNVHALNCSGFGKCATLSHILLIWRLRIQSKLFLAHFYLSYPLFKNWLINLMWWCVPEFLEPRWLRKEDCNSEAGLVWVVTFCLKGIPLFTNADFFFLWKFKNKMLQIFSHLPSLLFSVVVPNLHNIFFIPMKNNLIQHELKKNPTV